MKKALSHRAITISMMAIALVLMLSTAIYALGYGSVGPTGYIAHSSTTYTATNFSGSTATLKISGSTTLYPIINDSIDDFMTLNPGVTFDVRQGGSGVGKDDVGLDVTDIGMSSSSLVTWNGIINGNPVTVVEGNYLNDHLIGRDAVCVIVNSSVTGITTLTKAQIKDIYQGAITNWNQVGGPNLPIKPYGRIIGSGTRQSFIELVGGFSRDSSGNYNLEIATVGTNRVDSNGAMVAAINSTSAAAQGAIGYVGLGFSYGLANAIELAVGGVLPTPQNIYQATYPLSRYLRLLTLKNDPTNSNAQVITNYINWIKDEDGQNIVKAQEFLKLIPDTDVNKNGYIGIEDASIVGMHWDETIATQTPGFTRADVNRDGECGILDMVEIGLWWDMTY